MQWVQDMKVYMVIWGWLYWQKIANYHHWNAENVSFEGPDAAGSNFDVGLGCQKRTLSHGGSEKISKCNFQKEFKILHH